METPRGIIAGFHKTAGGRVTLESLLVIQEETGRDGKQYVSRSIYDVDYSRAYGYIFHLSGFGGGPENPVSGIYFKSGNVDVQETPVEYVDIHDKPPWKSKKTLAIRKRNKTRRLKALPKAFDLSRCTDLLDWLEYNAISGDAVWCSECRDYSPGEELCKHCWWCDKTGNYSVPNERCLCKNRDECAMDEG